MGNTLGSLSRTLSLGGRDPVRVSTKTGDLKFSGTDNEVYIIFHDKNGNKSKEFKLDNILKNDFERGHTDTFRISDIGGDLVDVSMIEIWRDGLFDDNLFLDLVVVNRLNSGESYDFPINRWIPREQHLFIRVFDSSLPQDDPHLVQRRRELDQKRAVYQLGQKVKGIPVQCIDIPEEESFSQDYKWDLKIRKRKLFAVTKLKQITTGKWTSFEDTLNVYTSSYLPLPTPAKDKVFLDDEYFGEQRVSGCNPGMLRLCTKIPDNFAVSREMLEPFLEGKTMDKALEERRLFIIDYVILEGLEITDPTLELVAPLLLLYRTCAEKLLPIAIQLKQTPADENPVFLPNDPPYTWFAAKLWCNNADASIHQSKAHLGSTHLIMESLCTVTHRQMSPSHPIFRLLAPHFLYLIAINHLALARLVSPGGWIDTTMTIGRLGVFDITRRTFATWRMDVNGLLPADLKDRGVDDPSVLPHYPYRDDALVLYQAIQTYVRTVVCQLYDTDENIGDDQELQAWAAELSRPYSEGGVGINGVPGEGRLTNVDDIAAILTFAIFTSSVQHAAVNFNQYDQYGFPLAYPAILHGKPPKDKSPLTEGDIIAHLPDKRTTMDIMLVTRLLSERGTNALGDFEIPYSYDPLTMAALERFRADLVEARKTILAANQKRKYAYSILDPVEVPNAISI